MEQHGTRESRLALKISAGRPPIRSWKHTADPTEIDALNNELGVIIVAVDEDMLYLVEVEDARRIDAVLEAYRGAAIVDSAERNSSSSLE